MGGRTRPGALPSMVHVEFLFVRRLAATVPGGTLIRPGPEHEIPVGPVPGAKIPVTGDGMIVLTKDVALDQRMASEPHNYAVPIVRLTKPVIQKVIVMDPYGLGLGGI